MPQTYIRAVGPGVIARTAPVAESKTCTGWPVPGTAGRNGVGQEITAEAYGQGSERRPRDGRPVPRRDRVCRLVEQRGAPRRQRGHLDGREEGRQLAAQR